MIPRNASTFEMKLRSSYGMGALTNILEIIRNEMRPDLSSPDLKKIQITDLP